MTIRSLRWVVDHRFTIRRGRVRQITVAVIIALITLTAPIFEGVASGQGLPCGYWLVGTDGGIFNFGEAQFFGSTGSLHLQRPVVGISMAVKGSGASGYWLVASDGGIFAFNTGFHGSIPGLGLNPAGSGLPNSLNAPVVGMVPSADGGGYFMVASDGGVFAFGDAHFSGSCPGVGGCAGAAVAVVPDASGNGYWVMTNTGNVYAFGDAGYYGGPGTQSSPITSAVASTSGLGYYVLDRERTGVRLRRCLEGRWFVCGRGGRFGSGQRHLHHRRQHGVLDRDRAWQGATLWRRAICGGHVRNASQRADHRRDRVLIGAPRLSGHSAVYSVAPVVDRIERSKSDP